MDQDEVFKALADPSRRKLLDLLFQKNGQNLSELMVHLPMTRFGCMKHLQVLEEAGLLTTRKVGREKYHYLNPVPIQLVYDRWVSKYSQPWTQSLVGLKNRLEEIEEKEMTKKPSHVFQVFIRTTPEQLWQALTEGDLTRQYYMDCRVESSWQVGAPYHYTNPAGTTLIEGQVLEIEPPRRLVHSFLPLWVEEASPSTVTWEIEKVGPSCKLTVTHDGLDPDSALTGNLSGGWAQILSGLKTLLETGEPLIISD